MRGKKVPDPVKQLIIERFKNGERVDDLAIEFDLYPNTIRKWLAELNMSVNKADRRNTSEALQISKLKREKEQLLEIIGELTVLTRQPKQNLRDHLIAKKPAIPRTLICSSLVVSIHQWN